MAIHWFLIWKGFFEPLFVRFPEPISMHGPRRIDLVSPGHVPVEKCNPETLKLKILGISLAKIHDSFGRRKFFILWETINLCQYTGLQIIGL